jgi:uncharacterized membrane protein
MENKYTIEVTEEEIANIGFNRWVNKHKYQVISPLIPLILLIIVILVVTLVFKEKDGLIVNLLFGIGFPIGVGLFLRWLLIAYKKGREYQKSIKDGAELKF